MDEHTNGRKTEPPRWPVHVLRAWADPWFIEDIEGDALELFHRRARHAPRRARWQFAWDVLRFVRPYTRRRRASFTPTVGPIMLKNYLVLALRHLRKQPVYGFINVFGLAVGMACCLLILLLVRHEWSFDRFHENGDRIHRVVIQETAPDGTVSYRNKIQPAVAPALREEFPQVDRAVQFVGGTLLLQRDTELFHAEAHLADSTFFEVFTFPFLAGDPATALDDRSGAVLTRTTAARYFGDRPPADVIGQPLTIERGGTLYDFTVTGVVEDVPVNSSLVFDLVLSFGLYPNTIRLGGNDWGGRTSLYVQLREGEDRAAFQQALAPFTAVQLASRIDARRNADYLAPGDDAFQLVLQPLSKVHLQPERTVSYEREPYPPTYGYILGGIALLVLLIACINFVTLSLGRSTARAREVGMRKALGARRAQVARQFWGESLLLSGVAFLIGVMLARLALPWFNTLTQQSLAFDVFGDSAMLLIVIGLVVLVGVGAGGYPALVLSRFQPARVLKGQTGGGRGTRFTRGLVVLQYAIAVGMIVCTLVMVRQLDYLTGKDLGFRGEQVVVVQTGQVSSAEAAQALTVFRNELMPYETVENVVRTGYAFTQSYDTYGWEDMAGNRYEAHNIGADYDYVEMLGMRIVEGRDFDPRYPTDSLGSVLVNEAFVRAHNFTDPIGRRLDGMGGPGQFFTEDPTVVGVVADFNFLSLHEEVAPAVINMNPNYYMGMQAMLVKIAPTDIPATLARMEATWAGLFPELPFAYSFLDADMDRLYETERRWSRIVLYAALFAIGIACLGLFGLATLSVARRTKELGVRKVLGASTTGLVTLVVREFALLVAIASLVAAPLAWLGMRRWLDGFAYQTTLAWWLFVGAGLLALVIAVLTVAYHALRAASVNPADSLRYE